MGGKNTHSERFKNLGLARDFVVERFGGLARGDLIISSMDEQCLKEKGGEKNAYSITHMAPSPAKGNAREGFPASS